MTQPVMWCFVILPRALTCPLGVAGIFMHWPLFQSSGVLSPIGFVCVSVCLGLPFVTVLIALSFVCLPSLLGCLSRVTLFHLINSNLSWTLIRPLDFLARGLSLSLLALALDPLNVGGS